MNKFNEAGIRPVAMSVDTPEKTRDHMLQKAGCTFTFLSDPKLEVIRRYDLVHAGERSSGADISRQAEMGLRWWRDVVILSQPKRYFDDR